MNKFVHVTHNGKIILNGNRDPAHGLWVVLVGQVENSGSQHNIIYAIQNNYNQILVVALIEASSTKKEIL